jgi:hypothetical protein
MLMPTTPETAPTIAEAGKDDETYTRLNLRMLRNPAIVNLFDGCALSVPCHEPGTVPVGMMIAGTQNTDRKILAIGLAVEEVVWKIASSEARGRRPTKATARIVTMNATEIWRMGYTRRGFHLLHDQWGERSQPIDALPTHSSGCK